MLNINEIDNVKFRKSNIGGYRAEDVDNFIDEVKESVEKLQNENADLLNKVKILAKKIGEYKDSEESVHIALVKAQKLADDSIKEANIEAQRIVSAAQKDAERILSNTKNEIFMQERTLVQLRKKVKEFRSNILSMYKEHIKIVNDFTADERISEETLGKIENSYKEKDENENKQSAEVNSEPIQVKNESKFKDLKFGEDYDLAKDTSEPDLESSNRAN